MNDEVREAHLPKGREEAGAKRGRIERPLALLQVDQRDGAGPECPEKPRQGARSIAAQTTTGKRERAPSPSPGISAASRRVTRPSGVDESSPPPPTLPSARRRRLQSALTRHKLGEQILVGQKRRRLKKEPRGTSPPSMGGRSGVVHRLVSVAPRFFQAPPRDGCTFAPLPSHLPGRTGTLAPCCRRCSAHQKNGAPFGAPSDDLRGEERWHRSSRCHPVSRSRTSVSYGADFRELARRGMAALLAARAAVLARRNDQASGVLSALAWVRVCRNRATSRAVGAGDVYGAEVTVPPAEPDGVAVDVIEVERTVTIYCRAVERSTGLACRARFVACAKGIRENRALAPGPLAGGDAVEGGGGEEEAQLLEPTSCDGQGLYRGVGAVYGDVADLLAADVDAPSGIVDVCLGDGGVGLPVAW